MGFSSGDTPPPLEKEETTTQADTLANNDDNDDCTVVPSLTHRCAQNHGGDIQTLTPPQKPTPPTTWWDSIKTLTVYPTVAYMMVASPRWWSEITPLLLLGKIPLETHLDKLVGTEKVKGVITLTENWETFVTKEQWKKRGVDNLHIQTLDRSPVTISDLSVCVEFLRLHCGKGQKCFVHCKHGRGRSGMVVVAFLMVGHNMTYSEAVSYIQERHSELNLNKSQTNTVKGFKLCHSMMGDDWIRQFSCQ
jgi:atypical dual specificity phosphatase